METQTIDTIAVGGRTLELRDTFTRRPYGDSDAFIAVVTAAVSD
jgi:hypothetical protein